ncbi:MAG: HD domain-containing protein, partial [Treponema sp.]|nr:HD domain-containing protein [Treponema sp.]
RGVEQKGFHRFDVLDHSLLACDFAAREEAPQTVRLAALFHDLGKPATRKLDERGIWTFYQHEMASADLARQILWRFRYPKTVIEGTLHLIGEHMFHYEEIWSDAAVRRFIIRVGEDKLRDLFALRRADAYATAGMVPPGDFLLSLLDRINAVLAGGRAFSLKDLAVSGKDLMKIGIKPGKGMGIILRELWETVVNDPELNAREKLLEIAENLHRRYGGETGENGRG